MEKFQLKRILKQLLAIEDHLEAGLEDPIDSPLCIDCLQEKHIPLLEILSSECISGVCSTGKARELMNEIFSFTQTLKSDIKNPTEKTLKNLLSQTRNLRKQVYSLIQEGNSNDETVYIEP